MSQSGAGGVPRRSLFRNLHGFHRSRGPEPHEKIAKYESDIREGDIPILYTGWGARRDFTADYLSGYPAITVESAKWLVQKRPKGIGIDTLSFDKYQDEATLPIHNVLCPADLPLFEELNLPKAILERKRWWFMALPILYKGCSGARCRAVAIEWDE